MNAISKPLALGPLIDEYDEKVAGAQSAIEAFEAANRDMTAATTIRGQHARSRAFERARMPHLESVHRSLRVSAWWYLYEALQIKHIAPASDRSKFERDLEDPPEFNMDNIRATFGRYIKDPRQHILRGLAEVFCKLDPAYKSHSKVKVGVQGLPKRVIITGVFDSWGYTGSYGFEKATDTIRALRSYQGLPPMERYAVRDPKDANKVLKQGITDHIQNETPLDGLTFKRFKNGNLHIVFDKQTQLDINRALAEYYGDVLPDAPDEDATHGFSTTIAKDLQYYPSPMAVVRRLVDEVHGDRVKVLEPSAGCGRILTGIRERCPSAKVYGYEFHLGRAQKCRSKGFNVTVRNFLEVPPSPEFDYVCMNPPFYGRHYLKHINHAIGFLRPRGSLRAVLPATAWYDHEALPKGGRWEDLPVGSFSESGTNIPTGIWTYWAPAETEARAA